MKAAQDRVVPGEADPGKAVRRVAPAPALGGPRLVRTCMSSTGVIAILPNEDWDLHSGDPKPFPFAREVSFLSENPFDNLPRVR